MASHSCVLPFLCMASLLQLFLFLSPLRSFLSWLDSWWHKLSVICGFVSVLNICPNICIVVLLAVRSYWSQFVDQFILQITYSLCDMDHCLTQETVTAGGGLCCLLLWVRQVVIHLILSSFIVFHHKQWLSYTWDVHSDATGYSSFPVLANAL